MTDIQALVDQLAERRIAFCATAVPAPHTMP
jgi:hypothetical protein